MPNVPESFLEATRKTLLDVQLPRILELQDLAERYPDSTGLRECLSKILLSFGGLAQVLKVVSPTKSSLMSTTAETESIDVLARDISAILENLRPQLLEQRVQLAAGAPTLLEFVMSTIFDVSEALGHTAALRQHLRPAPAGDGDEVSGAIQ